MAPQQNVVFDHKKSIEPYDALWIIITQYNLIHDLTGDPYFLLKRWVR